MKQVFLKREHCSSLLLFFAGWGADEHLFDMTVCTGYDYLLCFDYRTMDFDYGLLDGYRTIRLLGWSMGVWAASQVFAGRAFPWEMRLAVNGTPLPVDDSYGIPKRLFDGTLDAFSATALCKFRRRMCGTAEEVKRFLSHAPYRPLEELREELAFLQEQVRTVCDFGFGWDKAVVSMNDRIFLPDNQLRYWQSVPVVRIEAAHYDEAFFADCLSGKKELWTKD